MKLYNPTYVYIIECSQLGLFYIGKHEGRWSDGPDGYMGSSDYLNAVRAEFKDFTFTKSLIEQFNNDTDATAFETEYIIIAREVAPNCLLNRAPNDGTHQWEHIGYGAITDTHLKDRLDRARKVVRPITLINGQYKCLIMVKKADGTAHAPFMPHRNLTPIPKYRTWSPELLQTYSNLPPGCYHFASVLEIGRQKNYRPLMLVEQFATEEEARVAGSAYAHLSSENYRLKVEEIVGDISTNSVNTSVATTLQHTKEID